MTILSFYELPNKDLIAFIAPMYAGDSIREVTIKIPDCEKSEVIAHLQNLFVDYNKAHKCAYLQIMSKKDYNMLYSD